MTESLTCTAHLVYAHITSSLSQCVSLTTTTYQVTSQQDPFSKAEVVTQADLDYVAYDLLSCYTV